MCSRNNDRRDRARGFSLLEVMVVLVIIALLASVIGINVKSHVDRGRREKARADISILSSQVKIFYGDHGRYPTTSEGLEVLVPKYIEQLSKDPWGRDYEYNLPGRRSDFEIISYGADGREGGEDEDQDLTNWNLIEDEDAS